MSGAAEILRAIALALLFLAAPLLSTPVLSHASLVGADPPDGAVVATAPERVILRFNEPVSPLTLRLVLPGGETRDLPDAEPQGASLAVSLPAWLDRGTHLLSWRVMSSDGHPVGGSVVFSVGEPSLEPHELARQRADRIRQSAIWLARMALYAGLLFGCGGAFYAAWIERAPVSGFSRRFVTAMLGLGFAGASISFGLQGVDAYDAPLSQLRDGRLWLQGLATSQGSTALIALAAMALAGFALDRPRRAPPLAAGALIAAAAAFAASGHASAASPQLVTRPMVFLHAASVAFWIGALVPLAAALARGRSGWPAFAAFSRIVPLAVAVLASSGGVLAAIQLREPEALWSTAYGRILGTKLLLVVLLLGLAAFNRFWLTPQVDAGDARAPRAMRRAIAAEMTFAVAILALVALWRFTPPPRSLIEAAAAPVYAHIHAGQAMADLQFDPPRNGARTIRIVLLDGAFGPLAAQEVTLLLSKPDAGIERLRLPARHAEDTIWLVPNVRLPATGNWRARVEILIDDFTRLAIEGDIELPR